MATVTIYTNLDGFELLSKYGSSFVAWNERREPTDIELQVPTSAVRIAEVKTKTSKFGNVYTMGCNFEVLEKEKW